MIALPSDVTKISREQMLNLVREELVCTIGSKCVPLTVPVIISLYSEDTGQNIKEIALKLGYPSPEQFLRSSELSDIIAEDFTDKAVGINKNHERELCFKVKETVPRTKHIFNAVTESNNYQRELIDQKHRLYRKLMNDPKFQTDVMQGKLRLLTVIKELGGEERYVDYQSIQKAYLDSTGDALDKEELRKYFRKIHIKSVIGAFMFDDLDTQTDKNRTGSLFLKMKRSLLEVTLECEEALKAQEQPPPQRKINYNTNSKNIGEKSTGLVPIFQPQKKEKKDPPPPPPAPKKRQSPPPRRERIPPPPPKEKKPQELVPMHERAENLYTNDPLLAQAALGATKDKDVFGIEAAIAGNIHKWQRVPHQVHRNRPHRTYFTEQKEAVEGEMENVEEENPGKQRQQNKEKVIQREERFQFSGENLQRSQKNNTGAKLYSLNGNRKFNNSNGPSSRSYFTKSKRGEGGGEPVDEDTGDSDDSFCEGLAKAKQVAEKPKYTQKGWGTYSDEDEYEEDKFGEDIAFGPREAAEEDKKKDKEEEVSMQHQQQQRRAFKNQITEAELKEKFQEVLKLKEESKDFFVERRQMMYEEQKEKEKARAERQLKWMKQFEPCATETKKPLRSKKAYLEQKSSTKGANEDKGETSTNDVFHKKRVPKPKYNLEVDSD